MGALPNVYPGYQVVSDQAIREKFQGAWGVDLSPDMGKMIPEMMDGLIDGSIKGMYIFGENSVESDPNIHHVRHALDSAEFLVVQDIFLTQTAQMAHVVLPGAVWAEVEGTFTNTERKVQRIRKAVEPPGHAKPNWIIFSEIGRRLGLNMPYATSREVFEEMASLTPSYSGITYDRIDSTDIQWPCPSEDHPGTRFLHQGRFTRGLGLFHAIEYRPSEELPDEEFPFILTTGRRYAHYHTRTMTGRCPSLDHEFPRPMAQIHIRDTERLGLQDGDSLKVTSRRGQVTTPVRLGDIVPEAAWKAYPAWSRLDIQKRVEILEEAAARMQRSSSEWPNLLTREQGHLLSESIGDCQFAIMSLQLSSALAAKLSQQEQQEITLDPQGGRWYIKRDSIGVVSVISPWNYPVGLTWIPMQQALLAGNTVVVKPSSYTPLTVSKTMEAVVDTFPPGVINFVPGSGSEVGSVLTTHPLVRKISFTGSTETGIDIMVKAASTLKNITLELSGNDAALILDDADLSESTLERMLGGVFFNASQVCMAIKRIYANESIYEKFVDSFINVASSIVVGNGLDSSATMGPLNNKEQLDKVKSIVEDARKRGAKVNQPGKKLDEKMFEKGYFHLPTIITDVGNSYKIVKEEQFGPVIPIMPFKDVEDAISLANDTTFGLRSSVWTKDKERGLKIAERLEAGYTWINHHSVLALEPFAPLGGHKQSGIGRAMGLEGLLSYAEAHTIVSR